MTLPLLHDLKLEPTRDEAARQDFVEAMRAFVLVDMAQDMQSHFEHKVQPQFEAENGRLPEGGVEVHRAMRPESPFRNYSSLRYNVQEMVWRAVIPTIERNADELSSRADQLRERRLANVGGSLTLNPELEIPDYVSRQDVHLMPGCYHSESGSEDMVAGSLYDGGLAVFSFGVMGTNLDDIGCSMSQFTKARFPDLKPHKILDMGCTVGHNAVPWAKTFPEAQMHAIDVSAPVLRYAHARALSQKARVHFSQQSAEQLDFADNSFDIVFSSMFLHELPTKAVRRTLSEAYRVLRPGGVMIHMELPPNSHTQPYDSFYLDWDSYYNNEPFYKAFRDQVPVDLVAEAGFDRDQYFEAVMPRYTYVEDADFQAAISQDAAFNSETGRLSDTINWYCFGAVKSA